MFEVSQEKLRARRKRLMKRLTKLENKLEEKEESGQKFGIRILQKRIEWLESRLSKLDGKIKKVKKGKRQVKQAEAEAEHVEKAESSAMKETTEEAEEIPVDEVAQIEAELEEVQEDEWGAEVDLYGMSERRKARILRRLQRLEVRLDKMEGRKQTAGRQRRITRVRNRIERLRQKLQAPPAETSTTTWGPTSYDPAGEDYISQLTVKDPGSYETSDEWVESFFGTDESVHSADRQPFVAYFARRAEQMGASPEDGFGAEGNDGGFFARIGTFFRTVFVEPVQAFFAPDKRAVRQERRGVRRDKVKAYMDKRRARIDRTQAARKSARQEQRTKQLRRDAGQARRTRRVESRKAARAAHKSAWEAHTPGVQASRRQLALARKNVRQAAQAARRNEQVEQRAVAQGQPPPPPVLLQGTEGWAMYTLDPESNVISYTHPGDRGIRQPVGSTPQGATRYGSPQRNHAGRRLPARAGHGLMGFRPSRPWAYQPLLPQRVPPAWRPPMPIGFATYPQPLPPGVGYLPSFAENYCAGGASRRGISVGSYMTAKDASAIASVRPEPAGPAVHNYHMLQDIEDEDLYDDDFDDLDWPVAERSVVLGSYNRSPQSSRRMRRAMRHFDDHEAEVLEAMGLEPEEVDTLFSAEVIAFGADADKAAEESKRPFARISALFKPDASGQSKIARTTGRIEKLTQRLDDLQRQYGPQAQVAPVAPAYVPPAPPARTGMSTGAKVGIGIGAVAVLGLAGFAVYKAAQ